MLDADFYNLTQATGGAIWQALGAMPQPDETPREPPPALLQLRPGRAESPGWFMVQAAEFDPEPLTVARLRVRDVYASERITFALLELLASELWLEPGDEEEYVLTAPGREILDRMRQSRQRVAQLEPLPPEQLARLASLLERVVNAGLDAGDPPGTWCLRHSRNRAPAADAAPLVRIHHAFSDLNAFRDDAHMAAWQPHEIAGYVWEAFSFVCDGRAATAQELVAQLHYRGYARREYASALATLSGRGWLARDDNGYTVTEEGQAVRAEAERLTDHYFYAPWRSALGADEIDEVDALLRDLRKNLQALAQQDG